MEPEAEDLATRTLLALSSEGDERQVDTLMPLVYERLRALAARWYRSQPSEATLQPTALVNEVYVHLIDQTRVQWRDRAHFLAVAAAAMRQLLIQSARRRGAAKRGGGWRRVELADEPSAPDARAVEVLAMNEALEELGALHPRQARVVEMRFFGGLTTKEIAAVLGVTTRTVESDWATARAYLESVLNET